METLSRPTDYTDHFPLLLLNIGMSSHNGDWNWKKVASPFARMFYVTGGHARIILPQGSYDLCPGHMYFIPPFTVHDYSCESHFNLYYLHVYEGQCHSGGLFENYDFPVEVESHPMDMTLIERLYILNPNMQLPDSNPDTYDNRHTLMEWVTRNHERSLGNRLESKGILLQLMSRFLSKALPKPSVSDGRIRAAIHYIGQHLSKPMSIEKLAAKACMSNDHFIRLFRRETGESPLHFILRKKTERAQLMLITDTLPIKAIAYALGFDDHSYFIRLFRKNTGTTPLAYRKMFTRYHPGG